MTNYARSFKLRSRIAHPETGRHTIALGACGAEALYASSFVSSYGFFGCRIQILPLPTMGRGNRPLVALLLAAHFALGQVKAGPVTFQTSSTPALFYLEKWRTGSDLLPPSYAAHTPSGKDSKLRKLARALTEDPDRFAHEQIEPNARLSQTAAILATLARDAALTRPAASKEICLAYAEEQVRQALTAT